MWSSEALSARTASSTLILSLRHSSASSLCAGRWQCGDFFALPLRSSFTCNCKRPAEKEKERENGRKKRKPRRHGNGLRHCPSPFPRLFSCDETTISFFLYSPVSFFGIARSCDHRQRHDLVRVSFQYLFNTFLPIMMFCGSRARQDDDRVSFQYLFSVLFPFFFTITSPGNRMALRAWYGVDWVSSEYLKRTSFPIMMSFGSQVCQFDDGVRFRSNFSRYSIVFFSSWSKMDRSSFYQHLPSIFTVSFK